MPEKIIGFSKLSREDKINWISSNFLNESSEYKKILNSYLNNDNEFNLYIIHFQKIVFQIFIYHTLYLLIFL